MAAVTRRRVQTTKITTTWSGASPVTADCFANAGLSQHQVSVWCSGLPTQGVVEISVRPMGAGFYVPVGTIDLTVNGTGTFMFCALIDGIQLSFPGGVSSGIIIGATIYSVGLYFTVGDDYLQDDARRRVVADMITNPNPWNGSGSVTATMTNHAGLAQHQLAITGGTGLVELQGRPQGGSAFVSIDVQCQQITASGMLVIFAGLWDAFRLVPQGTVTGSIQAQIASVGELLFFNNVAQGTYGSGTTIPVITVNGGGQIVDITSVPINVPAALGYMPIGTFNGRNGTGNPPNIILLSSDVTGALGYTPANPSTFISSFKNKIINGNFDWWQRGTSLVTTAVSTGYLADRWQYNSPGGTTAVYSQQAFTPGQTSVPNNPTYFMRHVTTSVAGASNGYLVAQPIESVYTLAGLPFSLSFWARADANRNIAVELNQSFGSGGSPSSLVTGIAVTTINLTSSWKLFTVTGTVPSISGKTIGNSFDGALYVNFWLDAGSSFNARTNSLGQQSGTFDFAQINLEGNAIPTSTEFRPREMEFSMCQRYYEKSYDYNVPPGTSSITTGQYIALLLGLASAIYEPGSMIQFRVTKRAAPTVTIYNPLSGSSGSAEDEVSAVSISASASNAGTNTFLVLTTAHASNTGYNIQFCWTANSEL